MLGTWLVVFIVAMGSTLGLVLVVAGIDLVVYIVKSWFGRSGY